MTIEKKILDGRKLIEAYRVEHKKLYEGLKSGEVPDHSAVNAKLAKDLKALEYNTATELYNASREADEEEYKAEHSLARELTPEEKLNVDYWRG